MAPVDIRRHHEALDWVRRIHDPSFDDWPAHVAWLEASPHNSAIFDEVSLDIEAATARLVAASGPPPRELSAPVNDNVPDARRRRLRRLTPALGIGLAAAVVAKVYLPTSDGGGTQPYSVRTAPGEQRAVRLPDGTRIALNGDTEVALDRADPRMATLKRGEALFSVIHDDRNPFTVQSGNAVLRDAGTVFDVIRMPRRTEVAVREGAVLYDPKGANLRIGAGRSLRLAGGEATVETIAASSVGGWRAGRLTYAGAPIGRVAEDLSRATGRVFAVDPAAAARPFSGVIVLKGDRDRVARRAAASTGLVLTPRRDGWRMALPNR